MIDTISTQDADCVHFVVNTAVNDLLPANTGGLLTPDKTNSQQWFAPGDSFTLISYGFTLPFSFAQGALYQAAIKGLPSLTFQLQEFGQPPVPINPLALQIICVPYLGGEITLGYFVDLAVLAAGSLYLGGKFTLSAVWNQLPRISMIGVPAALNGTTQYMPMWAKVEHSASFVV